jgi:hypothetical protein
MNREGHNPDTGQLVRLAGYGARKVVGNAGAEEFIMATVTSAPKGHG